MENNPKLQAFVRECQKAGLAEVDTTTVDECLSEFLLTNYCSFSAKKFGNAHYDLMHEVYHDFNAKIFNVLKSEHLSRYLLMGRKVH
jgi:hypothetical protein